MPALESVREEVALFFFLEQRDKISCEGLTEGCLRLQEEKGCGGKLQGQEEEARASLPQPLHPPPLPVDFGTLYIS